MIRLAEKKDYHQLAELRWEHLAEDDILYGETNIARCDKNEFIHEYVSFLNNDSLYKIFVIEQDGIIISAMYVSIIRKVPKPKETESYIAYLTNVHTKKEYRNRGKGTELLSYIKDCLKRIKCELIIAWPSENSVSWYMNNGFTSQNDVMECDL